jgi:hypothetical protein
VFSARDIGFLPQLWQQTIPQLKKSRTIPSAALSSQSGCAQHATESDLQKHWWAAQLLMRWCCAQHSRTQITNRGQASENLNFSALENHHMSYVHLDTVNTMTSGTGDMRFVSFRTCVWCEVTRARDTMLRVCNRRSKMGTVLKQLPTMGISSVFVIGLLVENN